jgi:hypothetical protein
MAKTNITVWHSAHGEILAIGRSTGKHKVNPVAAQNQFIVETEIEEANIKGLHLTHMVDTQTKSLVKHKKEKRP